LSGVIEVANEYIKRCSQVESAFHSDDCFCLLLLEETSQGLYKYHFVTTLCVQCIWQRFGYGPFHCFHIIRV